MDGVRHEGALKRRTERGKQHGYERRCGRRELRQTSRAPQVFSVWVVFRIVVLGGSLVCLDLSGLPRMETEEVNIEGGTPTGAWGDKRTFGIEAEATDLCAVDGHFTDEGVRS